MPSIPLELEYRKHFIVKHFMLECRKFVAGHKKYSSNPLSSLSANSCILAKSVAVMKEMDFF